MQDSQSFHFDRRQCRGSTGRSDEGRLHREDVHIAQGGEGDRLVATSRHRQSESDRGRSAVGA